MVIFAAWPALIGAGRENCVVLCCAGALGMAVSLGYCARERRENGAQRKGRFRQSTSKSMESDRR